MSELIKELDDVLTGEGAARNFAEEYPDAPQSAIETAKQIEENKKKVESIKEQIRSKNREKAEEFHAAVDALERRIGEVEVQTAALAAQAGVANNEEKQLLEKVGTDDVPDLSSLAKSLGS